MKYIIPLFLCLILSCSKDDSPSGQQAIVEQSQISNIYSELPADALFFDDGTLCILASSRENSGLKVIKFDVNTQVPVEVVSLYNQSDLAARDMLEIPGGYFFLTDYEVTPNMRTVKLMQVGTSLNPIGELEISTIHDEVGVKMIRKNDSGFIVLVNRKDKNTETRGFVLYETNGETVLNTHEFNHPILQSGSDIIRKQDGIGYYVFAHVIEDPIHSTDFVLYELDNTLEVVNKKYVGGNEYEEARKLLEDDFGNLYLFGHSASNDIEHQMYLVKLNANLDLIYEKHFGSGYHDGGQTFCFDENKDLILIGRTNAPDNTNESIQYMKVSTEGTVLDKFILGDQTQNRSDIVLHQNGVNYVIGYTTIDNNFTKNVEIFRIQYP